MHFSLLHLSLIQNVGLSAQKKVATEMVHRSVDAYAFTISDFLSLGLSLKVATTLAEGLSDKSILQKELALIEKHEILWTTFLDPEYPALLAHTHLPPLVLYWQGSAVWNDGCSLSVVGSRAATDYGRRAINHIVISCIKRGMIIVSGGALGIDSLAHEAALNHGGKTVVILGTGLLRPYPASNKKLFEAIVHSGGAVVSSFPLETVGNAWQFPLRNKIIAGMTRGTFVVQAAEKSGALITAQYALREGRNVYALPGQFDDELSAGCHKILKEGAQLVVSAYDILQDYGIQKEVQEDENKQEDVQESLLNLVVLAGKKIVQKIKLPKKEESFEKQEGILGYCKEPISLETLSELTGKQEDALLGELFLLQLEGKVEQDFAGLWCMR